MMMHKTPKQVVGLFECADSLYIYLDDTLIALRNSKVNVKSLLFFGDNLEQEEGMKFLLANNHDLNNRNNRKVEVVFSSTVEQPDALHFFVINTSFTFKEISGYIQEQTKLFESVAINTNVHLLNSDANIDYYNQREDDENTIILGSPAEPAIMSNNSTFSF